MGAGDKGVPAAPQLLNTVTMPNSFLPASGVEWIWQCAVLTAGLGLPSSGFVANWTKAHLHALSLVVPGWGFGDFHACPGEPRSFLLEFRPILAPVYLRA